MAYATRADIEAVFGNDNVRTWADLNNDGVVSSIANRIIAALLFAKESVVDAGLLGGPYIVPFIVPIPNMIMMLTATAAGVWLYESRGVDDFNAETGKANHQLTFQKSWVKNTIKLLHAGGIRLNIAATSSSPRTVPEVIK